MGKGPRPAGRAVVPVIEAEPVAAAAPAVEPLPAEAKSTAKEKKIEEPMPTPTPEPAAEPARESVPAAAASESAQPQERVFSLAVNAVPSAEPAARPMPMSAPTEPKVEVDGDDVKVTIGPRVYQVLWLEKSLARGRMQVNVKVSGANVRGEYRYHGDTFDMESAQRRASFIKQAAYELAVKEEAMHSDVGGLWGILQDKQRERIGKALAPAEEAASMTDAEQAAAMELLRDPRLLDRVLEDFELSGGGVADAAEAPGRGGAVVVLGRQEFAHGSRARLHPGGAQGELHGHDHTWGKRTSNTKSSPSRSSRARRPQAIR
jgi:hypothetical protein